MRTRKSTILVGALALASAAWGANLPGTEEYARTASKIYLGRVSDPGDKRLDPISKEDFSGIVGDLDHLIEHQVEDLLNSPRAPAPEQIVARINEVQGLYGSTDFLERLSRFSRLARVNQEGGLAG